MDAKTIVEELRLDYINVYSALKQFLEDGDLEQGQKLMDWVAEQEEKEQDLHAILLSKLENTTFSTDSDELRAVKQELKQVKADCEMLIQSKLNLQSKNEFQRDFQDENDHLRRLLESSERNVHEKEMELRNWKEKTEGISEKTKSQLRVEKLERLRVLQENRMLSEQISELEEQLQRFLS